MAALYCKSMQAPAPTTACSLVPHLVGYSTLSKRAVGAVASTVSLFTCLLLLAMGQLSSAQLASCERRRTCWGALQLSSHSSPVQSSPCPECP